MANDNKGSNAQRFDDMSNADLVAFIGGDVDPGTNRADLIVMAVETDANRRNQR
ncbi:MAG: hypothetical protein JWP13_212 [Candidatus Saccharibacteria bacterium]|nr:hypothetical protein [Candidatus Saccharibacteria bacterium]